MRSPYVNSRCVSRATILLKGAPTLIATATSVTVVARGTPLLATGGSGDMLTGLIGGLLAQGIPAERATMIGASVHGIAAELATDHEGGVRGLTLENVLRALPKAWRHMERPPILPPGVLADLRAPSQRTVRHDDLQAFVAQRTRRCCWGLPSAACHRALAVQGVVAAADRWSVNAMKCAWSARLLTCAR